mgnify:CR=1 FL=1|tara:strand:+ start:2331 stop:2822 length:492 start_codon:yes stop_codon:yes gene_type:complete
MEVAEQSAVPSVRDEIKEICHKAKKSKDISLLLEYATQLSQYLFYIQEQESGLNALTTDARLLINAAKESIKTSEYASAIFLNSAQGGGLAMNKAEKMAYLKSAELREELVLAQEAYAEVDKDYKDVKGFGNAVKEYLMTIRQKVKNLQIEAGVYPIRTDNQD